MRKRNKYSQKKIWDPAGIRTRDLLDATYIDITAELLEPTAEEQKHDNITARKVGIPCGLGGLTDVVLADTLTIHHLIASSSVISYSTWSPSLGTRLSLNILIGQCQVNKIWHCHYCRYTVAI